MRSRSISSGSKVEFCRMSEDIESKPDVFLQHLRIVGRALARRVSVEVAADRFDLLSDSESAAPTGALEGHVLEKMRDPVDVSLFVPRADIDPDTKRDRIDGIDAVGRDTQSVGQSGQLRRHPMTRSEVSGTPRVGANKPCHGI